MPVYVLAEPWHLGGGVAVADDDDVEAFGGIAGDPDRHDRRRVGCCLSASGSRCYERQYGRRGHHERASPHVPAP
jgi:hypothetical protein